MLYYRFCVQRKRVKYVNQDFKSNVMYLNSDLDTIDRNNVVYLRKCDITDIIYVYI